MSAKVTSPESAKPARRTHFLLRGPRASNGSTLPEEDQATATDTAAVVQELRTELESERKEVLEPLLRRMMDAAERISRGETVPAEVIREGIELWQMYVRRLHDVHVGQFAAARSSLPHTESCTLPLVEIVQDPQRADVRIGELRLVLGAYEADPKTNSALLSAVLVGSARSELAWENFEEDFARSCLPAHLSATALRQWTTSLIETRSAAEETRGRVAEYLERTEQYALAPTGPGVARGPAPVRAP